MSSPTQAPTTPPNPFPIAAQAAQVAQPTQAQSLPPPYTPPSEAGDDEVDDEDFATPSTTIHINASLTIRGNANIVSLPPLDATHLAAQITAALRQHNYQLGTDAGPLIIRIDRSMHIVGDRNTVGTFGMGAAGAGAAKAAAQRREEIAKRLAAARQRAGEMMAGAGAQAAGTKRKAEGEDGEDARQAKKVALSRAESCPPS